jgi:choline dehydrogenase-like flavoprotein
MATFDKNDDSVVVIVGSGAGGGTLGAELAMKGVKTVILEAGGRHETEDFQNDEWGSFGQISWLDKRTTSGSWRVAKDFSGLPAWIVKAVGGSTIHWAGASLRFQDARIQGRHNLWQRARRQPAGLADRPAEMDPWYDQGGRQAWASHAPTAFPACPATTTTRCWKPVRRSSATRKSTPAHGDQLRAARRPVGLPADRLLLPGLQVGRQMVDLGRRNSEGRGNRQP